MTDYLLNITIALFFGVPMAAGWIFKGANNGKRTSNNF